MRPPTRREFAKACYFELEIEIPGIRRLQIAPEVTAAQPDHQSADNERAAHSTTDCRPNPVVEIQRRNESGQARNQIEIRNDFV